jgi:hypothetical protein
LRLLDKMHNFLAGLIGQKEIRTIFKGVLHLMTNSITIRIPKNMALSEQISEVKKQLQEWLRSLNPKFKYSKDGLRLKRYETIGRKHIFDYELYYQTAASSRDEEPPPEDD